MRFLPACDLRCLVRWAADLDRSRGPFKQREVDIAERPLGQVRESRPGPGLRSGGMDRRALLVQGGFQAPGAVPGRFTRLRSRRGVRAANGRLG